MRVVYLCIFVGSDFYSMKKGALKKKGISSLTSYLVCGIQNIAKVTTTRLIFSTGLTWFHEIKKTIWERNEKPLARLV